MTAIRRALLVLVTAGLTGGCQCGLDTTKLDAIACASDEDCDVDQHCWEGSCTQSDCETPDDCGDGWSFDCQDGRCFARDCDEAADDCPEGATCVGGHCREDLVSCTTDQDCDDRQWCNGTERCEGGVCGPGQAVDCGAPPAACQLTVCDEATDACRVEPADDGDACDDGNPCTGPDRCQDQQCEGQGDACDDALDCTTGECLPGIGCVVVDGACAIDDACWAAGEGPADDPCVTCNPANDPRAWSPSGGGACDDGDDCTQGDSCQGTTCTGTAYSCDDGLGCTVDGCDGQGGCDLALRLGTCLIGGTCYVDGDENPGNSCEECASLSDARGWTADDSNAGSDDGIACTADTCVAGQATHIAQDASCGGNQVCAPCAGGCTARPTLQVDCGNGTVAPGGSRDCTVTGGGADTCLSCTSTLGMTSFVANTFEGCPNLPGLGWDVEGAAFGCDSGTLEFSTGVSRLTQTIDTRDLDTVRLCFDWSDVGAGLDDSLSVLVDVGQGFSTVWTGIQGPFADTDWEQDYVCVDLTAAVPAAADNPSVRVRITVDSDAGAIRVQDVAIDGWDAAHLSWPGRVFQDGFAGCDLGAWAAAGNGPNCPATAGLFAGQDVLEARANSWQLTRDADLSDRCDDLTAGFGHAVNDVQWPGDYARFYVDTGNGDQEIWTAAGTNRPDEAWLDREFSISLFAPDSRFQPALGLRLDATTGGPAHRIWIDDIWVDGAVCANGDDLVTVGPLAVGGRGTTVPVSSDVQTTANVECTWDGRPSTLARDRVLFRY